jgi:hypothetical protein
LQIEKLRSSIAQVLNPLGTMLLVKPYRRALFGLLGAKKGPRRISANQVQTIYSTANFIKVHLPQKSQLVANNNNNNNNNTMMQNITF